LLNCSHTALCSATTSIYNRIAEASQKFRKYFGGEPRRCSAHQQPTKALPSPRPPGRTTRRRLTPPHRPTRALARHANPETSPVVRILPAPWGPPGGNWWLPLSDRAVGGPEPPSVTSAGGGDPGTGSVDQWISGSVVEAGAPTEEPRPDANNARRQRPTTGATGALACVLNTRGFPQVFCTAPVIHPVRVQKYPWQAS
jgi:hypothetical protein